MGKFWIKIAVLAVIALGLIILARTTVKKTVESVENTRSFAEVIEEDERRLRAEPEVKQPARSEQAVEESKPEPQFKELCLEDKVRAEKLFEMAIAQRKIGRLPGMSYKLMVDYCRQIIEKWPGSVYAFKARRMLGEIPQRYRKQYNITEEEINPAN